MSWRPLLRIAGRDALRAKGRSALVLLLIALPVLAVTATDTLFATYRVDGPESLDRRLGTADALVRTMPGLDTIHQAFDPGDSNYLGSGTGEQPPTRPKEWTEILGADVRTVEVDSSEANVRTGTGFMAVRMTQTQVDSPLVQGLFTLERGRLPAAGEVAVNRPLVERGFGIGREVEFADGTTLKVSGIVRDGSQRAAPALVAWPGETGSATEGTRSWLVAGSPVTWDDVLALNELGAVVTSRLVVTDPPPDSALAPEYREAYPSGGGFSSATLAVVALVVAMAMLELVLLAGPAFAVGARRQARTLALMAACGGTPRQARRLVLANALVLGGLAAVGGVGVGIVLALVLSPLAQRLVPSWFGPFEVPWLHLVVIASFGLLSALLAALLPAWLTARQDVVAVLAGRRGDRPPSRRTPVLGAVLVAAGIAAAVAGRRPGGETLIAVGAIVTVIGATLVIPVVLRTVARLSGGLPLALRFAARDADRHRFRTVPAVAAVAATVAGVVTFGIAASSDEAENKATYVASLPMNAAAISMLTLPGAGPAPDLLGRAEAEVEQQLPGLATEAVRGVSSQSPGSWLYLELNEPGRRERPLLEGYSSPFNDAGVLVADTVPAFLGDLPGRVEAEDALAAGKAVVLTSRPVSGDRVRLLIERTDQETGEPLETRQRDLPAVFVRVATDTPRAAAVLPPALARRAGLPVKDVGLFLPGPLTEQQETTLTEAMTAVSPETMVNVERGYQRPGEVGIVLALLGGLGAVLMLGGTLTATFLALADARPDLATLSAVGAAPRTRRRVAASYALVVGLVGSVLGALIGFVPGLAVIVPLTTGTGAGPFLDVPWALIGGLVLGLPLITAGLVGLISRSRLPLVARLT